MQEEFNVKAKVVPPFALLRAAIRGDDGGLRELLRNGYPDVNELFPDPRESALHILAEDGKPELVTEMLMAGADVQLTDSQGRQALHFGAASGHIAVVQILLEAGADPDVQAVNGRTPLHWAAYSGDAKMVRFLVGYGANPFIRDAREDTPGDVARRCGFDMVASWLEDREIGQKAARQAAAVKTPRF